MRKIGEFRIIRQALLVFGHAYARPGTSGWKASRPHLLPASRSEEAGDVESPCLPTLLLLDVGLLHDALVGRDIVAHKLGKFFGRHEDRLDAERGILLTQFLQLHDAVHLRV